MSIVIIIIIFIIPPVMFTMRIIFSTNVTKFVAASACHVVAAFSLLNPEIAA